MANGPFEELFHGERGIEMPSDTAYMPTAYLVYLLVCIPITVWVARKLSSNGRVFLARGCKGNEELAGSISHLLSVGFYLLHIGLILLALQLGGHATNTIDTIELLSTKIGAVLLVLAVSNFAHLMLYARIHGKPGKYETNVTAA